MKLLASVSLLVLAYGHEVEQEVRNANRIFNEIHSSVRQFGSSLNHNGMAFFIATMPPGTELYHGTSSPVVVEGMDWLAFEPEHALVFARPESNRRPSTQNQSTENTPVHTNSGKPSRGYLHTYKTKHALRLLYLDGSSAAKSDKGTMDLQDRVLLRDDPLYKQGLRRLPEDEEDKERASRMCRIAQTEWDTRIDGFLRMEAGFELVLCNFERHLQVARITQAKRFDAPLGVITDISAFFKAIATRYHGIGGERISLDYDNYVSLFNYPEAIHFDDFGRPRVNSMDAAIDDVRQAVRNMVVASSNTTAKGTNWQAIADLIVSRYADKIDYLASGSITQLTDFKADVDRSLRPFIDYGNRDTAEEVDRCKVHFIPEYSRGNPGAAVQAIFEINTVICQTLSRLSLLRHDKPDALNHGVSVARALKKYLSWTEWKKCKDCSSNEMCFVPIWPLGSADDFEYPKCVNDVRKVGKDYWGRHQPNKKRDLRSEIVLGLSEESQHSSNGSCPAPSIFSLFSSASMLVG